MDEKSNDEKLMANLEWFAAKTVYRDQIVEDNTRKTFFEERVVLFRAVDFDDAIAKAEAEAAEYAAAGQNCVFLDFVDVFHLFEDEPVGDRTEVFSLMRESDLSDDAYLDRFYQDGNERSQQVDQ